MTKRLSVLLTLGAITAAPLSSVAQDPVDEVHSLTLRWTDLEHQKDLLLANWRTDRPILEQQLSLLQRETEELTAFLEETAAEQDEVERRRLELLEEQTRLEQEQTAMEAGLDSAGVALRALHPQLPPPLRAAWDEGLPRLDDPLLTASERLQLVIDLLGQLNDFEDRVTLNETVMTMADGREYLAQQVYLGLSHGWFVTADRRYAAAGIATHDGWQWTDSADGDAIARIVGILERRMSPELVSISLELNGGSDVGR